jgi:putative ABC transport system permease protein
MGKMLFHIAIRNLLRNKTFSFLNIIGLAIGMASAILILLWVQNELSYDSFYPNADRLYQSWNRDRSNKGIDCWNVTPKPLAPALKQEYPEIERATRVGWDETILFTVGEKKMNIKGTMVDPDFLPMFDFPLIKGDISKALDNPEDIVITRNLAKSLFGKEDAFGKIIRLDNKYNHRVSGIMENLPNNTQFDFEFLLPWSYMRTTNQDDSSWENNSAHNFVLLKSKTNIAAVNVKIQDIIIRHGNKTWTTQSFLYPIGKLRLYSNFENGVPVGGKIGSVKLFALIALFILLIACINFMNLSTARSEKRAKEVGIRKVVGAKKSSLIGQFIGESILLTLIAGAFALIMVQLSLPAFNMVTKKQLAVEYSHFGFWILFLGFILLTGLLAGSYPAFFLSSFKPVSVLKGTFKKVNALITPRKVLVVLQFTFAITLIISTIIIEKQIKYAMEREPGYDKNNITYSFLSGDMVKNFELIKNELIQKGIATAVSKTSAPLTEGWSSGGARWVGKNPNDRTEFNYYGTDGSIVPTAGLTLLEGRDIDLKQYPTDSNAAILNESAVRVMGFKNPIGQIINRGNWNTDWHVIGVVKDFILQSPYEPVKPMVIQGPKADWFNLVHVKLNKANPTAKNIANMAAVFSKYNPQYPFEYHFIDEQYAKKFEDEQNTGMLSFLFAGLTILISCLGLFGLATYMAESRIKEIGVRKVLGASVANIAGLLSRDFIKLVVISIGIASPIAWFSMNKWLDGYNYHINISLWIFFAAGLIAVFIALFTVSFQAIKAAITSPVRNLRTE